MALKSKPWNEVRQVPVEMAAPGEDLVRINLNVPRRVRKAWKDAANQQDVTLTELIVDAMSKYSTTHGKRGE